MQWTNEWIEEGVEKGFSRADKRSRHEAARDLVLRQLRRRLGAIPANLAPTNRRSGLGRPDSSSLHCDGRRRGVSDRIDDAHLVRSLRR